MKKYIIYLLTLLLVLSVASCFGGRSGVERYLTRKLDLNQEQQSILKDSNKTVRKLVRESRKKMHSIRGKIAANFSQDEFDAVATSTEIQQAIAEFSETIPTYAGAISQFHQSLSAEQKTVLNEMIEKRNTKMKERWAERDEKEADNDKLHYFDKRIGKRLRKTLNLTQNQQELLNQSGGQLTDLMNEARTKWRSMVEEIVPKLTQDEFDADSITADLQKAASEFSDTVPDYLAIVSQFHQSLDAEQKAELKAMVEKYEKKRKKRWEDRHDDDDDDDDDDDY